MGSIWRLKECARCGCEFEIDYEGILCPSCVDHDYNQKEWTESAENEPTEHMGGVSPCYGCELCNPDDDYYRGEGDLEC